MLNFPSHILTSARSSLHLEIQKIKRKQFACFSFTSISMPLKSERSHDMECPQWKGATEESLYNNTYSKSWEIQLPKSYSCHPKYG